MHLRCIANAIPLTFIISPKPQLNDAEKRFLEDFLAHFGLAECSVGKDNRHFDNFKTEFVSGVFHFDLKRIAYKFDVVKIDSLKRSSRVAHKACGGIADSHTRDEPYVR